MTQPTTSRRLFLATGSATAVFGALATATALENHPDAELLTLGRAFDAKRAKQDRLNYVRGVTDETLNAAHRACSEIVDHIIDAKATTLDGLKVKVRALSWLHDGEFEGIADTFGNMGIVNHNEIVKHAPTTDRLVADSILFDLVAMAGLEARQ